MSGRFVYWMNVSLDLKIEAEPGEQGGGDWLRITESLHREFNARARAMSVFVEGRTIYETMEAFWPAARDDASQPDVIREYGAIWTDMPKVLVSRTRTHADYHTRILGGDDVIDRLRDLRAETAGDIGVGGATLATAVLEAGLLDEVLLFTHPVVLGHGRPLFDRLVRPLSLDLLEHAVFEQDVTMHRYAVSPAS